MPGTSVPPAAVTGDVEGEHRVVGQRAGRVGEERRRYYCLVDLAGQPSTAIDGCARTAGATSWRCAQGEQRDGGAAGPPGDQARVDADQEVERKGWLGRRCALAKAQASFVGGAAERHSPSR